MQEMCGKAVDVCLSVSKFVPDWFATSKMLEILDNVVFSNDYIDLDHIDSDIITLFVDDMDINTMDFININFDDNDDDNDLGNLIRFRLVV